jgi:metal-sulfur cluster biosynthetic enzyme
MSQDLQLARRQIFDELTKIVDPEIGVSIMELELIDKVDIADGKVNVDLHLTSPFCPAVFGFKIAQDVKDNIYNVAGIHDVKVNVSNHFMAEAINKQVNESKPPQQQQQQPAAATPTTTTTDTSASTLDSKAETAEKKQN